MNLFSDFKFLWYNITRWLFIWWREKRLGWSRQTELWAIQAVEDKWKKVAPAFEAPFQNANEFLAQLEEPKLYKYLHAVADFVESDAYAVEIDNLILRFEKELSLRSQTDTERAGYRITLIFIHNFRKRLEFLAGRLKEIEAHDGRSVKEQIKSLI